MVNKSGVITLLVLLVSGLAVAGWYFYQSQPKTPEEYAMKVMAAVQERDIRTARRWAESGTEAFPENNGMWHLAANVASLQDKKEAAVRYLNNVKEDGKLTIGAFTQKAQLLIQLGRQSEAEKELAKVFAADPMDVNANLMQFAVCRMGGRSFEANRYIENLVRQKKVSSKLCFPRFVPDIAWISEEEDKAVLDAARGEENQPNAYTGSALNFLSQGKIAAALQTYEHAASLDPNCMEAQGRLGWCYRKSNNTSGYKKWREGLTKRTFQHPWTWLTLGAEAEEADQTEAAARCFAESIARDSNNRLAYASLARVLKKLGKPDQAEPFQKHGDLLNKIYTQLRPDSVPEATTEDGRVLVTNTLIEMGRHMEAIAWVMMLEMDAKEQQPPRKDPVLAELKKLVEPLKSKKPPVTGFIDPEALPLTNFDYKQFRLPDGIDPENAPESTPEAATD